MLDRKSKARKEGGICCVCHFMKVVNMENPLPGLEDHSLINLPIHCLILCVCHEISFFIWFCFSLSLKCHYPMPGLFNTLIFCDPAWISPPLWSPPCSFHASSVLREYFKLVLNEYLKMILASYCFSLSQNSKLLEGGHQVLFASVLPGLVSVCWIKCTIFKSLVKLNQDAHRVGPKLCWQSSVEATATLYCWLKSTCMDSDTQITKNVS